MEIKFSIPLHTGDYVTDFGLAVLKNGVSLCKIKDHVLLAYSPLCDDNLLCEMFYFLLHLFLVRIGSIKKERKNNYCNRKATWTHQIRENNVTWGLKLGTVYYIIVYISYMIGH